LVRFGVMTSPTFQSSPRAVLGIVNYAAAKLGKLW